MGLKKFSRRSFILAGFSLLSYVYYEVHTISVKRYRIAIKKLPPAFDGFTILHLSDLHCKEYGSGQKKVLDLIGGFKFDMVACTGDFVDKRNPDTKPAIELISGLIEKPVYFVPGNHDHSSSKISEVLGSLGVTVLNNKAEKYIKDNSHVWIVGVDDPYLGLDRLDLAMEVVRDSAPRILMAHAPSIFPSAIQENIDLVLVGHTHGGQVRIPFVGAIIVPGQGLFPKFDYGVYNHQNTDMVINGGLGESMLPLRFNSRPEIVLITIEKAKGA